MLSRWRERSAVLAIALVAMVAWGSSAAGGDGSRAIRVSTLDGRTLAVIPVGENGTFALRYRNSLYGTLAEERFLVSVGGAITLVGLEAEQLAVLEEYYGAVAPVRDPRLGWRAAPAHAPVIDTLQIAATDRGERTLLVAGRAPLELFRFVDDRTPSVLIEVVP